MATSKAVGFAVDPPPLAAAPFGLVNRLTLQPDDVRWEGGVGYESSACAGSLQVWDLCSDVPAVDRPGHRPLPVFAPVFGVTAEDTCSSTMSADFRESAKRRVEERLDASTQFMVERELRDGAHASAHDPLGRWLTGPGTVVLDPGGTGLCPKAATAVLEDAFAGCDGGYGGAGVLHMTRGSASVLQDLVEDDGVLFTQLGTPVIAGAGYVPSAAGTGFDDGAWMFITGPVQVWLGDIAVYPEELVQAVNVTTNDIKFKAERLAAVTFDGCCVYAVKVDLTKTC